MKIHDRYLEEMLPKAEAGDVESQYQVGRYYINSGQEDKAFQWVQRAAAQGYLKAVAGLARCFLLGYGTTKDEKKGLELLQTAMEGGEPEAYNGYGIYYDFVLRDSERAIAYYTEAMENGIKAAQYNLACMYVYREEGSNHLAKGVELLKDLAENGDGAACYELYYIYETSEDGPFEDHRTAVKYLLMGAELGDPECMYQAAYYYLPVNDLYKPQADLEKYKYWIKKASEAGHPGAQFSMASEYMAGDTFPLNIPEAISLAEAAMPQISDEDRESFNEFVDMLLQDENTIGRLPETIINYGMEHGMTSALFALGMRSLYGDGTERNVSQGIQYLERAARSGNELARETLAIQYTTGELIPTNYERAAELAWSVVEDNPNSEAGIRLLAGVYFEWDSVNPQKALQGLLRMIQTLPDLPVQVRADVCSEIGYLYRNSNPVEGFKWTKRAAEDGSPMAQFNLGLNYYYGSGVTKDIMKAREWWKKAAEQGVSEAQTKLNETAKEVPKKGFLDWLFS